MYHKYFKNQKYVYVKKNHKVYIYTIRLLPTAYSLSFTLKKKVLS